MPSAPRRPVVQGHRGWRAAWPENTLAGFAAAIAAGVDAIELDVGLTRDGVVVVCHDPRLDPDLTRGPDGVWIGGPGPLLVDTTFAELRAFDVGRIRPGSPTAAAFPRQRPVDGARVPTLAEVFDLAAGSACWIDVELKTDPARPDLTAPPEALVDAVLAAAAVRPEPPRLALRSFDERGLRHAARRRPDVPLTWLTEADDAAAPDRLDGLAGTWAPAHPAATREAIARARQMALRVVPWTVNDASDIARLIAWGADGICTDDIVLARTVIDTA